MGSNNDLAENRRKKSVFAKIKSYQKQKLVIKSALSSVDLKKKEDTDGEPVNKKVLFDSDDDADVTFAEKPQFDGEEGQKLFALQTKYKNDERFKLDKRFLEESNEVVKTDDNDVSVAQEKENQMKLLDEILGVQQPKKLKVDPSLNHSSSVGMVRFDPTQSAHSKFEVLTEQNPVKGKKKRKELAPEIVLPEVSKDVYYEVDEGNIKEALESKQQFSLLNTFGSREVREEQEPDREKSLIGLEVAQDTSDEEQENAVQEEPLVTKPKQPSNFITESFFFAEDDFRFQDGLDFVKRIASNQSSNFGQLRRDLRQIAKSKVKNNQRKDQPFKKKLGGAKRKKVIRLKKALKK